MTPKTAKSSKASKTETASKTKKTATTEKAKPDKKTGAAKTTKPAPPKVKPKAVKVIAKAKPVKTTKRKATRIKAKGVHKAKPGKIAKKRKVTPIKKVKPEKKTIEKPKEGKFIAGAKEVNIYSVAGKSLRKQKLPVAFDEEFRLDLIRRAVKAARANRRQAYGPNPRAGMSHPSSTWGKGRGVARVQRQVSGRTAVESPNNVGGRRAHPPTVEKVWTEKVNKKERLKARRAALAAITDSDLVTNRGHKFDDKITLPLILEDEFEKINKTKDAMEVFKKVGVYHDILRAEYGVHIRAGKGKSRGRKYRRPKSVLIIATDRSMIRKGIGNLTGVDVVVPEKLSVEDLAPGGDPGRLTIITEGALKIMGNW
jgi:large subunit ribosomal protein L4e